MHIYLAFLLCIRAKLLVVLFHLQPRWNRRPYSILPTANICVASLSGPTATPPTDERKKGLSQTTDYSSPRFPPGKALLPNFLPGTFQFPPENGCLPNRYSSQSFSQAFASRASSKLKRYSSLRQPIRVFRLLESLG